MSNSGKSPFSAAGNFHLVGENADKIGELFTEFLQLLMDEQKVTVTSYNYNFYYNPKGPTEPSKLKEAKHPNEGGKDSFTVKAGE